MNEPTGQISEDVSALDGGAVLKTDANDVAGDEREIRVKFTGTLSEYFGIWIVNLALTLATLGIYSAWAKVRKNRYLYGNTWVDGVSFQYHAQPQRILVGRIVAVTLLIVLFFTSKYLFVLTGGLTYLVATLLAGLIIVSAMRFRLRNTSWRNLKFRFDGSYWRGFWLYTVGTVISVCTLMLVYPLFMQRRKRFMARHTLFANYRAGFTGNVLDVYVGYAGMVLCYLVLFVVMMLGLSLTMKLITLNPDLDSTISFAGTPLIVIPLMLVVYAIAAFGWVYIKAYLIRYTWRHTTYYETSFVSKVTARRLFWIYATNTLGVMLTLGLLFPWATIRLARYKTEAITITTSRNADGLTGHRQEERSAYGEELAEAFDLGFA